MTTMAEWFANEDNRTAFQAANNEAMRQERINRLRDLLESTEILWWDAQPGSADRERLAIQASSIARDLAAAESGN